ncbi:hypothetical protein [Tessaracoccus sp. O5.2]|uniref:hypothetical protein n=1 Tax=Tessaracoccus sp. O5.2 TaxID=3157622 RepID=UPI0036DDB06D
MAAPVARIIAAGVNTSVTLVLAGTATVTPSAARIGDGLNSVVVAAAATSTMSPLRIAAVARVSHEWITLSEAS